MVITEPNYKLIERFINYSTIDELISHNNVGAVSLLLKKTFYLSYRSLYLAAENNNLQMVQLLIENRVFVEYADTCIPTDPKVKQLLKDYYNSYRFIR